MSRLLCLAHRLLSWHRTTALEWFLGAASAICGALLVMPWDTFSQATLLNRFPEAAVGAVFLVHGAATMWVVGSPLLRAAIHGDRQRPRSLRNLGLCRSSAAASIWLWVAVAVTYVLPPPEPETTLALPLVVAFACASVWCYLRLAIVEERWKRSGQEL